MKHTLLFLFAALQTGFLFAQFDENYFGYYKSPDETMFVYLNKYTVDEFGDMSMTAEQEKNCAFAFALATDVDAAGSFATKKGNVYVSEPNEYSAVYTFAFKMGSDGIRSVEVTEKSGKKTLLTQYTPEIEGGYYDDEYVDDGSADDYGYYDEEAPIIESLDIRGYSRSDGAVLLMTFSEEAAVFSLHIPATKSCSEIIIEGVFDTPNLVNEAYTYTNVEQGYSLEFKAFDFGWQIKCLKGECPDKKGKCGIWKEAFILNN